MDILFERRVVLGGAEIGTVVNGHIKQMWTSLVQKHSKISTAAYFKQEFILFSRFDAASGCHFDKKQSITSRR